MTWPFHSVTKRPLKIVNLEPNSLRLQERSSNEKKKELAEDLKKWNPRKAKGNKSTFPGLSKYAL